MPTKKAKNSVREEQSPTKKSILKKYGKESFNHKNTSKARTIKSYSIKDIK